MILEKPNRPLAHGIPVPANSILGRQKEVEELIQLLGHHTVVTITGTGGIGKTRLAIEICQRLPKGSFDEIVFVSMATLTDAREVMPEVAGKLGITEYANQSPAIGVAEALNKKQILLVLDNLEHVDSASKEISELISACPQAKVLCTSRTPLKISVEQEYPIQTLPLPKNIQVESILEYPAIDLFLRSVKKVNVNFELTTVNTSYIIQICQYLDGLPLALELAAYRLRVLTPEQLLKRLDKALNILSTGPEDFPLRHQTIRNTIEWSHQLLNASEQQLFRRLAVFVNGFTLESIEEVCYENAIDALAALDDIESLVEKGLVQKQGWNSRFTILQVIKDFATEKLIEAEEVPSISINHAKYFHRISKLILEGTQGVHQQERMDLGLAEEDNILTALDYLLELAQRNNPDAQDMGLDVCGNLWLYWHIRGKHVTTKDYVNAFFKATEDMVPSPGKCGALFSLHVAYYTLGEIEQSLEVGAQLVKMANTLENEFELVKGFIALGFGAMFSNLPQSIQYNENAVKLARKLSATYWLALARWQGGIFNLIAGNLEIAKASYAESLKIFSELNEYEGIGIAQSGLCTLEFLAGNYHHALELYAETLLAFETIGDRPEQARVLSEIAWTHLANQDTRKALQFALASIDAHQEIGSNRGIGLSMNALAAIMAVNGQAVRALEIAAAAQHFADQKGVAIELGVNNHGEIYLENAKKKLSQSEIEHAKQTGLNYTLKDILEMVKPVSAIGTPDYSSENELLKRLEGAMEEHLDDSTFGVAELANAVSMSQMQVYRKLKALKLQTPSQFIRNFRLEKSKELLKHSDRTIAEIAYQVGFVDPNYFSRSFMNDSS
ncbi:MAG: helix-turn-helix domain-containing protein [Saprospiraceae bacterium]